LAIRRAAIPRRHRHAIAAEASKSIPKLNSVIAALMKSV
jgi:hypothetical protein